MTRTQRIRGILRGETPDRIAISAWMHMPLVDRDPDDFAQATIDFTETNQLDFIKVMSSPYYMVEAYGADINFSDDPRRWISEFNRYPYENADQIAQTPVLGKDNPVFLREEKLMGNLYRHYKGDTPIIATIFNPLTWIKYMVNTKNVTVEWLLQNKRKELHKACEAIQQSNFNLLDMLLPQKIDGIFLASQYSTEMTMGREDYLEFIAPYEKQILDYVKKDTWFNMLHVHGDKHIFFKEVLDYPVQALNWEEHHADASDSERVSIAQAKELTDKVLICGIDQRSDFELGSPEAIRARLAEKLKIALEESGNRHFIFSTGCGVPVTTDPALVRLIHQVVAEHEGAGA